MKLRSQIAVLAAKVEGYGRQRRRTTSTKQTRQHNNKGVVIPYHTYTLQVCDGEFCFVPHCA